jgi:S-formylglutathione hydrolase FrmB
MAVINMDFYSKELKMSTVLTVAVPDSAKISEKPMSERKCLYLLHGLSDDGSAAVRFSKIELYARETGIVVIMPSVGRSMYCDNVLGQNYFTHVAEEIPQYMKSLFGISRKKEHSYIAGISMGGMGAARIALTYPERFAAVGLFSGLLDIKMMLPLILASDEYKREFPFMEEVIQSPDNTTLSPINLLDAEKHKNLKIIVRCGAEDELYPMSVSFYKKAKTLGLDVTGILEPQGGHNWREWDKYIDQFVKSMV